MHKNCNCAGCQVDREEEARKSRKAGVVMEMPVPAVIPVRTGWIAPVEEIPKKAKPLTRHFNILANNALQKPHPKDLPQPKYDSGVDVEKQVFLMGRIKYLKGRPALDKRDPLLTKYRSWTSMDIFTRRRR
jgi:hypothetical protein